MPSDIQAAGVRPVEFSVIATGSTDPTRTKLDTIDTVCRQTLGAFDTFVCGITTVCIPTR